MSSLIDQIETLLEEAEKFKPSGPEEAERFRIRFLGRNGILRSLFTELADLPPAQRKEAGQRINTLRKKAEEKSKANVALPKNVSEHSEDDLTRPGFPFEPGSRHPISIVRKRMTDIFLRMGFEISEGPEIEDDWHNFTALNIPAGHPAREMQDTFFIERRPPAAGGDILLRTHTSPQQIRVMEARQPPIRIICPGRVYRNETISARSHCIFHQIEGLYVDEGVSFADMKRTLYHFAAEMFGKETGVRLRPSYFPFTEPSGEMDISCLLCNGKGCSLCKETGWVEILGCGMVHPHVLENCRIDNKKYTGFAFGLGIERPAMLQYRIPDIRLFFENDVRFLQQFRSAIS